MTSRKAAREALTGAHAGRALSRVILKNQNADAVPKGGRQHQLVRNREHGLDSARSKTPARMETPRARSGRPHPLYPIATVIETQEDVSASYSTVFVEKVAKSVHLKNISTLVARNHG